MYVCVYVYVCVCVYLCISYTVHRVPKFTSCHNAIMVVTGRAHCSILLYIYIYTIEYIYNIYIYNIYIYMSVRVIGR